METSHAAAPPLINHLVVNLNPHAVTNRAATTTIKRDVHGSP